MGPLLKFWAWRLVILVPVLVWASAGGPWQAPFMWALFGYVLYRALPGIRQDVVKLRFASPRGKRHSSRGTL